ncbi:MAG: LTA synthase family protein, partial [Clostridium perfringens]|nr:LTA synthase family protein [Clostridium perfringens]
MQEKVKLNNGLSKFKESLNKNALIRLGFYIFTLIAIVLKGALFLGFSLNQNLYTLNFGLGYRQASYFINYYIAFAAIFVSICFLFKNKGKFFSLIIVDLFITLITVMDIWYFRGFQTVPSVMLLKQTANLDNLGDSIFSMASPYDLLFFVDFIILIIAFIIFRKSFKNCKSNWKGTLIVLLVSICYIGYVPFNVNVLKRENVKNSYLFSNYDPTNTVEYFSPIGYHIFDIYNVYKNSKPYKMTADDEAKIKEYYDFKNENLPDNEFKGMFKGKNLIVIQVESLEDFVI